MASKSETLIDHPFGNLDKENGFEKCANILVTYSVTSLLEYVIRVRK